MSGSDKTIIFDLGAVMVDWNPTKIVKNFTSNVILQNTIINGLFQHDDWLKFDSGELTEQELINRATETTSLTASDIDRLMVQAKESLHAKETMIALLQLAHQKSLKTYCLSNLSHEWYDYLIHRYDFFQLFDGHVISAQEGISKPNPKIYQRILRRYHIDPQRALFIDDREENTQAAKQFDLKTITFTHSEADLSKIHRFITDKLDGTD